MRRRYAWLYVYAFPRPATGRNWWRPLPILSTEAFAPALAEFARGEGIGPTKRVVPALDRAGWRPANDLALPAGAHPAFPPAASPELLPVEQLWPLLDQPVANRAFADLDALEAVLVAILGADRRAVRAHTRFRW